MGIAAEMKKFDIEQDWTRMKTFLRIRQWRCYGQSTNDNNISGVMYCFNFKKLAKIGDNEYLSSMVVDRNGLNFLYSATDKFIINLAGCFGYEPEMSKKEFAKEKCMQIMFGWKCCPFWYKIAHIIELFIMDAFVDLFITLCIVINTVFMALESDGMNSALESILSNGNYVRTINFFDTGIW